MSARIRLNGAKALELIAGARPPAPPRSPRVPAKPAPLAPPGTVLARFEVAGTPVPWRAPTGGKGGVHYSPAHVKRWKEAVARAAEAAGFGESTGQAPYAGPVQVLVTFCRPCTAARRPGDRWDRRPDGDNLNKAVVDSFTGNVFRKSGKDPVTGDKIPARLMPPSPVGRILLDDNQVTDVAIRKRYWTRGLCFVEVVAVAPHDPGPYPFAP